ncbi:MAG: rhodanese-like domain-containing protein [Bacteroidetes bacterium]|jgi:rhodanese-related sulfurtransferase|nr:rhodanese-like domain-containing protein [Bacteroidota bacterium]HNR19318.1 rhodanese-like domain-containing protein [Bacteroidia bacterium]HNU33526.1 rhodanese-like domain-containing protein [Bacteroidia bacterium]
MINFIKKIFHSQADVQLKEMINNKALLVDVRTKEEFANGHVKGSVNIPLDNIVKDLNRFKDKNGIVVFCRSGMRSSRAKSILEQNGIANVINGGTWQSVNKLVNG